MLSKTFLFLSLLLICIRSLTCMSILYSNSYINIFFISLTQAREFHQSTISSTLPPVPPSSSNRIPPPPPPPVFGYPPSSSISFLPSNGPLIPLPGIQGQHGGPLIPFPGVQSPHDILSVRPYPMTTSTVTKSSNSDYDQNNDDERCKNNINYSSDSVIAPVIKYASSSSSFVSIHDETCDTSNVPKNEVNQRNEVVFTDVPVSTSNSTNDVPVKIFSFSMKSSFLKKK